MSLSSEGKAGTISSWSSLLRIKIALFIFMLVLLGKSKKDFIDRDRVIHCIKSYSSKYICGNWLLYFPLYNEE